MRFDVLTLFPEIIENYCSESIVGRATESGIFTVNTVNPRDYTLDKHKKVDDTPYGGGAGMVLMAQPYVDAYESVEKLDNSLTIMLTPQGKPLNCALVSEFTKYNQIIMLCGHYEGFDERIREIIRPLEVSLGDFVLTGGELPALCVIDAVSRHIDGTLGHIESAEDDTFSNGLIEYPHYTKPRSFRGLEVPEVLLNGNHRDIANFRLEKSLERTKEKRPDLYEKYLNER
ncbi:tRNA (guanosine(37)-N1)-methyltransferase TrmD [bacterium]|nr:tRNA (guanosine(37)-N1)-methyltransferase TrmD [bacterium]